ncbi:ATP-grasp ribosomal peptide maturase [Yinghuangia sp. YIM S09857]|uniref:ATP-grasp ribosomal peptide maturase n=1 Tax=Yinghuangia sp. YIM S09857 TaxID=3436929 RepID=UPI003F529A6E
MTGGTAEHGERPVWVVTQADDSTADLVILELHRRGVPVVRFDSGDFPHSLSVTGEIGGQGVGWRGSLATASRTSALDRVRALYYRRPSGFSYPALSSQDAKFATAQARYGLGGIVASLPGCLYVNHPHRIGDAEFKPAGLASAVACGFSVPRTLVTNEPEAAKAFAQRHAPVLFKPLWCSAWQDVRGDWCAPAVAPVTAEAIDEQVSSTMHLFQEVVRKSGDIRTTVIGDRVFSVLIESELLDWRDNYDALAYRVIDTPGRVRTCIDRYMRSFGLVFGAFDFAYTAEGEWIFLECNPSGQFAWLEPRTGLRMVAALADLLQEGT